jgi:iron complex outermembrane receptor protein
MFFKRFTRLRNFKALYPEKGGVSGLVLFAFLLTPFTSGAALAEVRSPEEEKRAVFMESVTVTANKVEENITDVPQSISVIDAFTIEERSMRNIGDAISLIPNMSVNPSHGRQVNIRGLNSSIFTNNNPVVLYMDGIPQTGRYGFDASLANVERIEVLRGPQGTLYGKDAIGGIINVVTREPGDTWQGSVGAEYGSWNFMQTSMNVNGPVKKDLLYMGLNGVFQKDDGWIKNIHPGMEKEANGKDSRKLGAYLLYKPTDRLRMRLTVNDEEENKDWRSGYVLPSGSPFSAVRRKDAEHVDFDVKSFDNTESQSQGLNLAYAFDRMELTSVTTRRKVIQKGDYDGDFANQALYAGLKQFSNMEHESWTQEIRLASSNQEGIRWVGGIYLDRDTLDYGPYGQQFPNFDPVSMQFLGNFEMNAVSATDSETRAIFGQVMVPLGKRMEMTLGGRYQSIEKKMDLDMYYLPVGGSGPPFYVLHTKKTWDVFLPKAAFAYKINEDWTAYASWSRGYMPGGFNNFAMGGEEKDNRFDPQQSTNYEVGLKAALQKLHFSAVLFHMEIEDIHVYKGVGNMYLTSNAKKAHSQGAELEAVWMPTDSLEISTALGIVDAEYDDYDAGSVKFDGKNIEHTPSHTARLGVAYYHPGGFYSRFDAKNQGAIHFYDDVNKDFVKQDAFTLVDMRLGYRFKNWDVYVYGKNLTDEEYVTNFMCNSLVSLADFGDPRTFGMGVRYTF